MHSIKCPILDLELHGQCVATKCIHHSQRIQSGCGYRLPVIYSSIAKNRGVRVSDIKNSVSNRMNRIYLANMLYHYAEFCNDSAVTRKGVALYRRLKVSKVWRIMAIQELISAERVSSMLKRSNYERFKAIHRMDISLAEFFRTIIVEDMT